MRAEGGWAGVPLVLQDGGAPADDGVFEGWGAEGGAAEVEGWAGGCEGGGGEIEEAVYGVEAGSAGRLAWGG